MVNFLWSFSAPVVNFYVIKDIERLNQEVRRRERVIHIFPNRESGLRLIGAVLLEIDNKWAEGRRYLDMSDYLEWRKQEVNNITPFAKFHGCQLYATLPAGFAQNVGRDHLWLYPLFLRK